MDSRHTHQIYLRWSTIHMLKDNTLLDLIAKGFVKNIYCVINIRILDFNSKRIICSVSSIWNRFLCSALKNGDSSYYYLFLTYLLNLSYQSYLSIVFLYYLQSQYLITIHYFMLIELRNLFFDIIVFLKHER